MNSASATARARRTRRSSRTGSERRPRMADLEHSPTPCPASPEPATAPARASPVPLKARSAGPGGTTSPQQSRERTVAEKPDPATGAAPSSRAAPVRGRASRTPAGTGTSPTSLRRDGTVPAGTRTFTLELPAGLKLINLNERLHWSEERRRAREIKNAACGGARPGRCRGSSASASPPSTSRLTSGTATGITTPKSAKHALDGISRGRLPAGGRRALRHRDLLPDRHPVPEGASCPDPD